MATTEKLIDGLQSGSRQACEELYRRYALRVLFLVRARMGPALRIKEQSGDLAQEALLKSLHGLEEFIADSDGAFIAYLAKKVEEVIRDRVDYWQAAKRNPQRERSILQTQFTHSIVSPHATRDPSPIDVLDQHEDIERLLLALDTLRDQNEEYWDLLVVRRLENRSYEEIAAARGGRRRQCAKSANGP